MNRAYSLVELLVTVAIVGVLGLLGMRLYNEQKQSAHATWAKAEMMDVFQLMRTAQSYDGHYHQFIYAMGYRPKGKVLAAVGTAADSNTICCDQYPSKGSDPCAKNWRSGYSYYNCKSGALDTATDNIEICQGTGYSQSCEIKSGLKALQTSDFPGCPPHPAEWCNCERFTLGAVIFSGKKLTVSDQRVFCEEG